MFLIIGLGNIGEKYDSTRHNIGFDAIDKIAEVYNISINRKKFKGEYGEGFIGGEKTLIIKPTTFMNLSGECVREVIDFYKLTNEDILVIYDDISLDVGKLRIREKGSAGGHNGIKSIISHLGTDQFSRIKIGVGQPKDDLVKHVLGNFSKIEREILDDSLEAVAKAAETVIKEDTKTAMNKFNGFKPKEIV
ncbi:peptidyl-tRNA hydrolase [Clostridium thermobutyricum]|uniref:Peptidyl-tRNA hydrolase n=1 Tax=Clostridium thermobutyricum TaxID=29372 RepID=N9XWQ7_9CLOT|nr:aminoacyl-tRNA hydrolase [Clostridium thermobutyricum]ENZ00354.1 peptidyl-tRNA hydrolase [Clostridium thermobutyricum]